MGRNPQVLYEMYNSLTKSLGILIKEIYLTYIYYNTLTPCVKARSTTLSFYIFEVEEAVMGHQVYISV